MLTDPADDVAALAPTAPGGSFLPDPAASSAGSPEPVFDFDEAFQEKVAAMTLRDTTFMARVGPLIKPEYFESETERFLADMSLEFHKRYKKALDSSIIPTVFKDHVDRRRPPHDLKEDAKKKLVRLLKVDISGRDFVVDKIANFAKHQAIGKAMTSAIEHWQKGNHADVEKLMKAAFLVGSDNDGQAIDYWSDEAIDRRTKRREDMAAGLIKPDGITTGHGELDSYLQPHLGWGRKELSVVMGAAKAGKSMSLGEFAKNASLAGHNVLYCSCEVSGEIIEDRTDANVARIALKIMKSRAADVAAALKRMRAGAGKLIIREFASGSLRPSQLRGVIEYYRALGITFDLIITDYADIMAPDYRVDDQRENLRMIYLDLRGIAFDYHAAVLTATQTNRDGAKAATAKMTDVADDFNKVRTCDAMIGINATEEERSNGEARLFFAAMRNAEDGFTLRIQQDRSCMTFIKSIIGRE